MKLILASDVHGSAFWAGKLLEVYQQQQPDWLILLGDLLYHGPRNDLPQGYAPKEVIAMLNGIKDKILAVRGNCEAEVDQMVLEFPVMADYSQLVLENGKVLFFTHGHLFSPEKMPLLPQGSLFAYGHTHIKKAEWKNGIGILNPGSVSIPKDGSHSYLVYQDGLFTSYNLENGEKIATFAV